MVNISSICSCGVILQHCSFYMVPVMVNLSSLGCCNVILRVLETIPIIHIVHNSLHFNHWKCQPCHMRLGCQLFALHSATLNLWSVYTGPRSIHTKSVPCQTNPDTQIKAEPVYTVIYTVIKTVPKYVQCNLKKSMTSQWQEAEAYFSAYVRGRGGRRSGTFLTVKSTTTTTTTTTYWRQ